MQKFQILVLSFFISLNISENLEAAPTAPSGLSATGGTNFITLSWTDNSSNEATFQIVRSTDNVNFYSLSIVDSQTTSYRDRRIPTGTTFYYKVRAVNSSGASAYTASTSATTGAGSPPTAPSGLGGVAVSYSEVSLSWTDNSNNETSFRVERSPNGTTGWAELGSSNPNTPSFTDSTVTGYTTYYYRVRARNGSGDSSYSNVADVFTTVGAGGGIGNPTSISSIGANPWGLVAADFNGDNLTDLAVVSTAANRIEVLVLNEFGQINDSDLYSVAGVYGTAYEIVAADINNDNAQDLVFLTSSSYAGVLVNQGDGTFSGPVMYFAIDHSSVSSAQGLEVRDVLNADGCADIITTNYGYDAISVTPGFCDGSFSGAAQDIFAGPVSGGARYSVAGYFNADADLDIVSANYLDASLFILFGSGGSLGSLSQAVQPGGQFYPTTLVAGDVNEDGFTDVVAYSEADETLYILTNDTTAHFGVQATLAAPADPACYARGMLLADINGDSHLDLVVTGLTASTTSYFEGVGDGNFNPEQTLNASESRGVAVGLQNGDNSRSFYYTNRTGNSIYWDNHP